MSRLPGGRTPAVLLALLAGATTALAAAPSASADVRSLFAQHGPDAPIMVAAHRADWRSAPENSLPAVEAAIKAGVEVIEIDVKRTKDGQLVIMHDDSVNRTTSGTGNVSDLTFEQVRGLRLREGLGNGSAALTDERVPTLEEVMRAVKGKALINLDKAWGYRDQVYDVLVATDTVEYGMFKSNAPVAEVQAFRAKDPRIIYSHIVEDGNNGSPAQFGDDQPEAYELIFDNLLDAQAQPPYAANLAKTSRVFINTMWKGLAAGYTDEASLRNPRFGWKAVIQDHSATIIQTDNIPELQRYLAGADVTALPDPATQFRVQAEDYAAGKGTGYWDSDDNNIPGQYRPYEGVDVCDQQGALVVCYTRQGEWLRYDIDVPQSGTYKVYGRIAVNAPTGRVFLDYGNGVTSTPVNIRNTTSHDAFNLQLLDSERKLSAGKQSIWFRMDGTGTQNFNLDYLRFDRTADGPTMTFPTPVGGTVPATLGLTLAGNLSFGTFVPGVARDYDAATEATITSSAQDAALTVTGGKLANGSRTLASPLQVKAGATMPLTPLDGTLALQSWTGPVSREVTPIAVRQSIAANDPLATGTYATTLTFTLSTTQP
ncbi:glycerophosphodiester phosphodiesterase family protein [Solirubrobacter phytolaccae]|uniref:Glycerophosphodiester phosphodiesterase family protein n=1 Tax=Solirubrobacter phytolaccae TaxID=1404360 RepID=A0A9X3SBZ6_9ACTN|nr:glycerophosphodiester phosphodiesterase family protein [Solirubrobacter phytolaccae]MDA0184101.1 glycerophosphodiester phosphodiesterase family protein [Solirubrobacter phytolaccae]